jgi:hypothetical protein
MKPHRHFPDAWHGLFHESKGLRIRADAADHRFVCIWLHFERKRVCPIVECEDKWLVPNVS